MYKGDGWKKAVNERTLAASRVTIEAREPRGRRFDFDVQLKVHFPLSRHFAIFEVPLENVCPNGHRPCTDLKSSAP